MPWRIASCDVCGVDDPSIVMLKNDIWLSIAEKKEILCYNCIEKRLNRKLQISDLKPDSMCTRIMLLGLRLGTGISPPKTLSGEEIKDIAHRIVVGGIFPEMSVRNKKTIKGYIFSVAGNFFCIQPKKLPTANERKQFQEIVATLIRNGIQQALERTGAK